VTSEESRGPTSFSVEGWTVIAQRGLPASLATFEASASLRVSFDRTSNAGDAFFVAIGVASEWPSLVVTQRFSPCQEGFDPGIAFVPTTRTLFMGAGTRLLAYRLDDPPFQLWEDAAAVGFWHWSVHAEAVLMAAELELAAWDPSGVKLWSCKVEPPWDYNVIDGRVRLDVMGAVREFNIVTGP
jgi:hypothetical protein